MNNELDKIWLEIETQRSNGNGCFQRMVCVDYLYRIYIGVSGIPSKRFISFEIPHSQRDSISEYVSPQGFTIAIGEPIVKHEGYSACILQSSSSDQNDVFTIVVEDVLLDLKANQEEEHYVKALTHRIEKWKDFFKNTNINRISETTEVGLIGELSFLKNLLVNGINIGPEMWNGPIKAAQDFQAEKIAIEIKTAVTKEIEKVHISSEEQLDLDGREALFMTVYRLERNDLNGVTLPALVDEVANMLSDRQRSKFVASLYCLGYSSDDRNLYKRGFVTKEIVSYAIAGEFPRITRQNLPKGIEKTKYDLLLNSCDQYKIETEIVLERIKELCSG